MKTTKKAIIKKMIITMHCHAGEEEAKVVERGGGERNGLNRSWHLAPDTWHLALEGKF